MPSTSERASETQDGRSPFLSPRWFVVTFWHGHRTLVRVTRGRLGLWRPKAGRWGALWLTTTGRRSGRSRRVVVGYFEDGDNFVTMAMNGWGAPEPAWWLNLQAHPDAIVRTRDGVREVRAHRAAGAERERLWARWCAIDEHLDEYAARRPNETAVVVFEPTSAAGAAARPSAAGARAPSPYRQPAHQDDTGVEHQFEDPPRDVTAWDAGIADSCGGSWRHSWWRRPCRCWPDAEVTRRPLRSHRRRSPERSVLPSRPTLPSWSPSAAP